MSDGQLLGPGQPDPQMRTEQMVADDVWQTIAGQESVTALEAKALYVLGQMRHFAEAANKLLLTPGPMHMPALGLLCAAHELLGRCRKGDANERGNATELLRKGLGLSVADGIPGADGTYMYTVRDIVALRNFTLHGGTHGQVVLEPALIIGLSGRFAGQITSYWLDLQNDADTRASLAVALVGPLFTDGRVIHVAAMRNIVRNGGAAGSNLLWSADRP